MSVILFYSSVSGSLEVKYAVFLVSLLLLQATYTTYLQKFELNMSYLDITVCTVLTFFNLSTISQLITHINCKTGL